VTLPLVITEPLLQVLGKGIGYPNTIPGIKIEGEPRLS